MAAAIHADVSRAHPLVGWGTMDDVPEYPSKLVVRLVTDRPSEYVLVAESLTDLRAQLPCYLSRAGRQSADPADSCGTLAQVMLPDFATNGKPCREMRR